MHVRGFGVHPVSVNTHATADKPVGLEPFCYCLEVLVPDISFSAEGLCHDHFYHDGHTQL